MRVLPVLLATVLICGSIQAEIHTVEYGESLWRIAKKRYGNGKKWRWIWDANRTKIRRPNHIRPGQKLEIPRSHPKKNAPAGVPAGYEYWKTVRAKCTAYCPCRRCCGRFANGKTSTGRNAWRPDGCGVDPRLIPYGTLVKIPGAGIRKADDTGPAMRRSSRRGIYHIDVRYASHWTARKWGKRWRRVVLYRRVRKSVSDSARKSKSPQS